MLLNDIFLNAVSKWPDRVALHSQGEAWTYQQLYQRASHYAANIQHAVGQADSRCVAILGTKSLETTAVILGTLLAGFTYMPLDITLPAKRLETTLQIARPALLITTTLNAYLKNQLSQLPSLPPVMDINGLTILPPLKNPTFAAFNPEKIAYVLFTSGSTGTPKGVCISHRAVTSALTMLLEHIPFSATDNIASQSAFCYDLSVFDLFSAFTVGASVHLLTPDIMKVPAHFLTYIQENQLTSLYMVSSALEYILKYKQDHTTRLPLKRILLTGDPISSTLISLMKTTLNADCEIYNLYSAVEMPYAYTQPILLAGENNHLKLFPLKGSQIQASLEDGGVLVIKGPVLFSGYITAEKTLHEIEQQPIHTYRTGDWVAQHEAGIELFGRVDRQVKILGNRIELDDIEINLEALPPVQEAAVVVDQTTQQLHGFLVLLESYTNNPDILATVKQRCLLSLPAIMVPQHLHFISQMPRTTSGKKDRKSLLSNTSEIHLLAQE